MTKEQCENLKKWGLPQDISPGSVIYFKTDNTPSFYTSGVIKESDYIIDPSVESMIQFVVKIGEKLSDVFYLSIDYDYEEKTWEVYYEFRLPANIYGHDLKEVLYEIIEEYNNEI